MGLKGVQLRRLPVLYAHNKSLSTSSTHSSSNLEVFREINKLSSEGKWDSINNKPSLWLRGPAKREAYTTYMKFNKSSNFFDKSAWGPYMKIVWRLALLYGIVQSGVILYELIVPEDQRLKYKYRVKDQPHH